MQTVHLGMPCVSAPAEDRGGSGGQSKKPSCDAGPAGGQPGPRGAQEPARDLTVLLSRTKISGPLHSCIDWLLDVGHLGRGQTLARWVSGAEATPKGADN